MKSLTIKKLIYSFILFLILFSLVGCSFAASGVTKLELVEDNVCTINISDIGEFEKKQTAFSAKDKSITITLTMKNKKTVETSRMQVEVFLVIDNSSSMIKNKVNDTQTRKEAVINSANTLINKLFEANEQAKVGIVSFSSLDHLKGETEGTINDAKLLLSLTDSKTEIASAISTISSSETGPRTNIEAGITVASENYSSNENTKRYIVLLTDGVPNNALDGSWETYTGTVGARTKAKLEAIEKTGTKIIGAMIGLDSEKTEPTSKKTYKTLAEEVFGTIDNPTISEFHYISDKDIEETIVNKLFQNIVSVKDNTLKNIVIKDYFPKEIVENFDFQYVSQPTKGTISPKIDTTDNSITWTIPVLKEQETATVSYKLTLKENYKKEIINKILSTNEKVDITAEDEDHDEDDPYKGTSPETPKVRVLYEEPEEPEKPTPPTIIPTPEEPVDNTIAPDVIPQTGESDIIAISIMIVSAIAVIAIVRYIYINKNNIER